MTVDAQWPVDFNRSLRDWIDRLGVCSRSTAYRWTNGNEQLSLVELRHIVRVRATRDMPAKDRSAFLEEWTGHWESEWQTASISSLDPEATPAHVPVPAELDPWIHVRDRLGVVNAYVPLRNESGAGPASTNARRNARKLDVLMQAVEHRATVRLMAETGNSYLHLRGPFNHAISALLDAGGSFQAVLMCPDQHLRGDQAELKLKFNQSLRGYRELDRLYGHRIDLKILPSRMTSTVLVAGGSSFFEPYLHVESDDRERLLLNTFELEVAAESPFHSTLLGNFNLHYRQAKRPDKWLRNM